MTSDRSHDRKRGPEPPRKRGDRPAPPRIDTDREDWSALQHSVGNARLVEDLAGADRAQLLVDPDLVQTLQEAVGNAAVRRLLAESPIVRAAADEEAREEAWPVSAETRERIEAQRGVGARVLASAPAAFAGQDLSDVRVHDGAEASTLARTVHAEAFTSGRDVFLGDGALRATRGSEVLAHELVHVAHEAGVATGASVQRLPEGAAKPEEKPAADPGEREMYDRAAGLFHAHKYAEAQELFAALRAKSSSEAVQRDCYYDEGMCALKRENYTDAIVRFNAYLGFAGADTVRAEEKLMEAGRAGIGVKDEKPGGAGEAPGGKEGKGEKKNPVLQMGSAGPDVQYLQVLLNDALKYRLPESLALDAKYGIKTATAVGLLQWSSGVAAIDGICGPETWELLKAMYAQKTMEVTKKPT